MDKDRELRVRASAIGTAQESYNYYVERMALSKGVDIKTAQDYAIVKSYKEMLGVKGYTGDEY